MDTRVLARLPHGMILDVEERYETWSRVNAQGLVGYVLNAYVRFEDYPIQPTASPEPTPSPEETLSPETTPTPAPTAPPVETELVARIALAGPGSKLNMRTDAGTWAGVLTRIPHGAYVRVLFYDPSWSQVEYEGWTGYVSSQYLVLEERPVTVPQETMTPEATPSASPAPEIELPSEVVVSVSSSLNMRSQPSTRGKIVARLYDGDRATVIGQDAGWYQVRYGTLTGWLSADYVVPVYGGAPVPEQTAQPLATPTPEQTPPPVSTPNPEDPKATPSPQQPEATSVPQATPAPEQTAQPTQEPTREPESAATARPEDVVNTGEARAGACLRERERDDAGVLLELSSGDDVRVVEYASSQWARAESQGIYGYIRLTDLYLDYWAAVCDLDGGAAALYESMDEEAPTVGTLSDAEIVTVYEVQEGWARIRTGGGRKGYCPEGLLNIL